MTAADLIAFETEVAALWDAGKLRAPCHLSGGNESQLINLFKRIPPHEWVLSTYRWHYHALLHGIPRETVMQWILDGRGMCVGSREHRFLTSAIVGGLLPIAVGMAEALKRRDSPCKIWCFVGDMASRIGAFHEATTYAERNALPVVFVVEDNAMSCNSPTRECWGMERGGNNVVSYDYIRTLPHVGTGKWIKFE